MATFELSENVATDKIFLVQRSELEGRIEPGYYKPDIATIEQAVRNKSSKRLKDFIVKIASGATPAVEEEEKYYSDKENGVPFLRVQNLQTNGKLNIDDVKYINKETHNSYLKRSQVAEGDLLVKITGVGRMAIASVATPEFDGNTNQHMVVIKTGSRVISEYLANYLNLNIVEKLASRRSTGGTRPALDYPALKSIPIVENLDFTILNKAEAKKQQKEIEAKALLDSINDYLLAELGITLHQRDGNLQNRIFTACFSDVMGIRLDVFGVGNSEYKIEGGIYPNKKLKLIANLAKGQSITSDKVIEGKYPVIAGGQSSPYNHNVYNNLGNIITISASGAYSGFVWYHSTPIFASDCTVISSKKEEEVSTIYIAEVLKVKQKEIYALQQGSGQPHVYASDLRELNIPVPGMKKQVEVLKHIKKIRDKAKQLQTEAQNIIEEARQAIEKMILN